MYSGLRDGTYGTLQRLLQDLGFNSYKQLQEPNSSRHVQTSETNQQDASEIELSYSSAPHSVAARAHPSTPSEDGPLETLQAMLLDLEAHKEIKTEIDSDNSSQGEVFQAATVLQADLLGLNSPTYKASSSEVSPSIQAVATEPSRHRSPSDVAVAALSDVLETNDKQHLSITILLNDNQQLQDKLDATKAELSNVRMEKHTASNACAANELLLAESQEAAKQARIGQSQMQARADAASQAAAAAEAKLAGQAVTGRGYMERMALLKSQLHDLEKRLESQGTDARDMRSQAIQTDLSVCQSSTQQELEQQTLPAAVNDSMHKEMVAQQLPQELQAACPDAQDISSQLATSQKAQQGLQAEVLELTQRKSDTTAKLAELDAAQAHAIALQDRLASSDQHLRQSKHALASAQAAFQQALDQQGCQHAINVQALEQQLLAVQQEHAKAAEQLSDMTKQHQESKVQGHHIQRLQAAAAETAQVNTAQQQRHHAQLSAMQEECDGLQGQLVQAQARVKSTSQHSVQLQHDLQAQLALAAHEAVKAHEHEQALAGTQSQLATAQAVAAQQANRADKLVACWATTQEQLATTAAQLAEYATCRNQGQETIDGLLLQVQQLQRQSAAANSKHKQELAASVQSGKQQADAAAAAQEQALLVSHNQASLTQHQEELSHVPAESACQLAALQILCDDLEGKLSAKQSDLVNLQEKQSHAVLELQQQLSAAEVAIAAAQSQAAASAESLAEQTSKVSLLTEKLTLALAQGTNLQERLDAAAARLTDSTLNSKATEARLQAEITAAKVTAEDREQLAAQLKTELATVSTQLQAAEVEACVQHKTAQQALVDTQAQHAEHAGNLESKVLQAQSDRERQHDQLQQCSKDLSKGLEQEGLLSDALSAANQRTSALNDTVKQQQQELTEQTAQQQATSAQLTAAQDQAESALHRLASAEAKVTAAQAQAQAESEAAAVQLSSFQQQFAAVQAEQAEAEEQHQQALSRLAAQLGTADDKNAELSLALAALESKLTVAKSQAEADSQTAAQKLVGATTGMDAANETVADLREQLHMVTSEAQKQLTEQLQTSEEASTQLQIKLEATQQAAAHRQAQHDSELAALQKASCQLHEQLQSAQQANAAMQSQSAAAQQNNLRCQAQLQSELAASQQAVSQAEAELQASQQSHRELVSQSEAAQQASYHTQDQLQIDLKLSLEVVAQLSAQLQSSQLSVDHLQQQMQELKESPLHAQLAERHFTQQLAALPQPEGQAEGYPGLHHSLSRGPGSGLNALLSSEVGRLQEEVASLRGRVQGYEVDVDHLVATSDLGHANPKQKIQYHLRWKQELETIRKECTVLLRERYMLEQCVRYLAVRLGLNVAVVKDVSGQHERTALDRVQPASLTQHYKFANHSRHLSDARLEVADLEDLELTQNRGLGELGKADAPLTASSAGQASPHSAVGADSNLSSMARAGVTEASAEGVEAHILARIAAICQPGLYQKAKQAQGSTSRADRPAAAMKGPASPEPSDRHTSSPLL